MTFRSYFILSWFGCISKAFWPSFPSKIATKLNSRSILDFENRVTHNYQPLDENESSEEVEAETEEILGFSFSPGGLLFPYHLGVLNVLAKNLYITNATPLAGSSAGAIAVAALAAGIDLDEALDACIRISHRCKELGGARGKLHFLLVEEMNALLPDDVDLRLNQRTGMTVLAHREIFPRNRPVFRCNFDSKEDVIEAVWSSCMFPFFLTNLPFGIQRPHKKKPSSTKTVELIKKNATQKHEKRLKLKLRIPRLVVDGYFSVPRERFGCPEFPPSCNVTRTIMVSCFPHNVVGMVPSHERDQISPIIDQLNWTSYAQELFIKATQPSTPESHLEIYELGKSDALRWIEQEKELSD